MKLVAQIALGLLAAWCMFWGSMAVVVVCMWAVSRFFELAGR